MSRFAYKGVDLTPFLTFLKAERDIGNERSIAKDDTPKIGTNIQRVSFAGKIIKVKVSLATREIGPQNFVDTTENVEVTDENLNKLREKVTSLLYAEEAYKLELPDEPDRYYLALPQGDINLSGITDWYDEATIEFFVPDGVAHSATYKEVRDPKVEGNKLIFDVDNAGNVPAFPIVTVKNNGSNGYVGLVNINGALEIGSTEERRQNAQTIPQSQVVLDYRTNPGGALSAGAKNVAVTNDNFETKNGTLRTVNAWNRQHIDLASVGNSGAHRAGTLSFDIPAGAAQSVDDFLWWRQVYWLATIADCGILKVTVTDESGAFLYGCETFKNAKGMNARFTAFAADGNGGYKNLRSWDFMAGHWKDKNMFNADQGETSIKRNNDKLEYYYLGSYYSFYVPEIRGKKATKVHFSFVKFDNLQLVKHMYLDGFYFRRDYTSKPAEIPNRFISGAEVTINCENDTVTVDGIDRIADVVDGSTFPELPVGKSTLEIHSSSWSTKAPSVTVRFEERWL